MITYHDKEVVAIASDSSKGGKGAFTPTGRFRKGNAPAVIVTNKSTGRGKKVYG